MTPATLFVCSLCRFSATEKSRDGLSGGQYYINQLQTELAARNLQDAVHLQPVRCMAACSRPCNVTIAAPDRLTFILSGLPTTESAGKLAEFCQQYTTCPGGRVPYHARSTTIRAASAFILPALPSQ
jgi:predicted metal-binding protein